MKLLHALTLFATLGLALARDFFATIGLDASLPMIGAFGLAVTTLLIFRGLLPIFAVAILATMASLPADYLQNLNLDHDLLIALVLIIIAYPWIHKLAQDS